MLSKILFYLCVLACGASSRLPEYTPFLVGGVIAQSSSDWPWIVALYYSGTFTGAGVYVGDGWVISAAHLVQVMRKDSTRQFVEQ